jgi:arylsulfatase A-like enzyme
MRRSRPLRAAGFAALLWAAVAPLACSPRDELRPDVVLVSIDTLRADRVGVYGANRDTSPQLDRLAREGARFDAAFAPTSWTLPSHVSLLTGMSMLRHRVIENSDRIDGRRRSVAQQFADEGWLTAGFVSAPYLHEAYGFARGFSLYRNFGVGGAVAALPPTQEEHRRSHGEDTAEQVIDAALAWLADRRGDPAQPIFLFVHLWDPHYDYAPPEPYDRMFDPDYSGSLDVSHYEERADLRQQMSSRDLQHLRALYDGEVRWTDSQVGRLLAALQARGRWDDTLVSVSSDHGEEFFEHGRRGHSHQLFDESVRVPWILRFPRAIAPGTVVTSPVSLAEVAPTLLELAGLPPLAEASGRSQAPELAGKLRDERPVLLSVRQRFALRGASWKVLGAGPGEPALHFDLATDPAEVRGRPAEEVAPERLAELVNRIAADRAAAERLHWDGDRTVELDASTTERLRELGYLDE